jgi:serine carboxypeptidase-like clade 2
VLYNGNWDVVVPYIDTVKNIKQKLRLRESYIYQPWFVNKQHAGFSQLYSGLLFLTVKGASHQVPQAKREAAFELFNNTLSGHPEFEILEKELKVNFVQE